MAKLNGIRIFMLLLWLIIVINLVINFPEPWYTTFLVAGIFLAVAHLLECFFFYNKIRACHENSALGFLQVFLFGVVHLRSLDDFQQ